MDEAVEQHIATLDLAKIDLRRTPFPRLGNGQREPAVRSLVVVVANVAAQRWHSMVRCIDAGRGRREHIEGSS
jgi:hypothetical protein